VVIAAVQATDTLITADQCRAALASRPGRPLVLIDLSVPRVVDPKAATVPGARLYSVDDLGDIAHRSAARRACEIPLVESIAWDEARRAYARIAARRQRANAVRS
jgi:glutamyl-tRNA reductase